MDLLVATRNLGKVKELKRLLADLPVSICGLTEIGQVNEIVEIGETFAENAAIKAAGYAKITGIPALADDSGLAIDYLGGAPGVRSARYAGELATDEDRIRKVLDQLRRMPDTQRTARFVCAMAFADAGGKVLFKAEGICAGTVIDAPRGAGGFGYDPIFIPEGFDKTFGELTTNVKNVISHRGRAFAKIIPYLRGFFDI